MKINIIKDPFTELSPLSTLPLTVTHNGKTMVNPLIEAVIQERLFLDGDIPELRNGPLPENCKPALPVQATTLNPIIVGEMLDRVSTDTLLEIRQQEEQYSKDNPGTQLVPMAYNVPGVYECGSVPMCVDVEPKTLPKLMLSKDTQIRKWLYQSIGTTQGRKSFVNLMEQTLVECVLNKGFTYSEETPSTTQEFKSKWVLQTWGPDEMQLGFNYPELAVKKAVEDFVGNVKPCKIYSVQVGTVDLYSDRVFGWTFLIKHGEVV